MADRERWFGRLSVPKPWPGLHGLRVEGNNLSLDGNGEIVTEMHGGWKAGGSRTRYDRINLLSVAMIPANMMKLPAVYATTSSSPPVRDVFARGGRAVRGSASASEQEVVAVDGGESDECDADLPPDFERIIHTHRSDGSHLTRAYSTYKGPLGNFPSKSAAWAAYRDSLKNVEVVEPVSPSLSTTSALDSAHGPVSPVLATSPYASAYAAPVVAPRRTVTSARSRGAKLPTSSRSREIQKLLSK